MKILLLCSTLKLTFPSYFLPQSSEYPLHYHTNQINLHHEICLPLIDIFSQQRETLSVLRIKQSTTLPESHNSSKDQTSTNSVGYSNGLFIDVDGPLSATHCLFGKSPGCSALLTAPLAVHRPMFRIIDTILFAFRPGDTCEPPKAKHTLGEHHRLPIPLR